MTKTMAADALAFCQAKSRTWDSLRAFNAGTVTADDHLAVVLDEDRIGDSFRETHFPNALWVFASCDRSIGQPGGVYIMTVNGPQLVWSEDKAA